MRILLSIIKYSFILIVLAVLGFLVSREVLLGWGTTTLKRSLSALRQAENRGAQADECRRRGSTAVAGDAMVLYQLRFLNHTQYQLEAVCNQFSQSPIVFERSTLPALVTKVPGESGFVWAELQRTGVQISVFEDIAKEIASVLPIDQELITRRSFVIVDDRVIVTTAAESDLNDGPVTSCEGYGYQCCTENTQVGTGDQIIGLNDCSESCYASCTSRPNILSFTSNPFFVGRSREVEIESGAIVEFMYVSDAKGTDSLRASIDFGDGIQSQLTGSQGSSSHAYTCDQVECRYTAILKLTDEWGVDSALTPLSSIGVIVRTP